MVIIAEKIGTAVIGFFASIGRIVILLCQVLVFMPKKIHFGRLMVQMAHLGVDSLPIVLLTVLFTGMVMTLQSATELIKYGAQASVGGLVAVSMGRELSPVLTGVVCAGRVGAAITAEIATMKVTEQIDALRSMATNPIGYLVVPRVLACILMQPILVALADLAGTLGGYFVAVYYAGINSATYLNSIKMFAAVQDVTFGMLKAMFFGLVIALVGCYKGLNADPGAEGVGKATTESVVVAIIAIFISNYFLSMLLFK